MKAISRLLNVWTLQRKEINLDNGIYLCSPRKNTIIKLTNL